jgi:hypothetical protein
MTYRRLITAVVTGLGLLTLTGGAALATSHFQIPVPGPAPELKEKLLPGKKLLPQCPDPAAQRIDFSIVSRTSQFRGRVRIVGVVKNVGLAAYESGPNQQSAQLYADGKFLVQQAFQNLAPSQEVTVTYERNWDASSPAEGEFPPTYKLLIVYDPDIRLDGNPKNDECTSANNKKERSGADINALFH